MIRKNEPDVRSNASILTARRFIASESVDAMTAGQIAHFRRNTLGISQRLFAGLLNVAPQTVHAWEQGGRTPSGMALRLLSIAKMHPETFRALVKSRTGRKRSPGGTS